MSVGTNTWLSALATGDPDASPFVPLGLYDLTSSDNSVVIDKTNRYIFDLSASGGGGGGGGLQSVAHDSTLTGNGTGLSPLGLANGAGVKTIAQGMVKTIAQGIQVSGGTGQNPTIANTGIISVTAASQLSATATSGNAAISISNPPTAYWSLSGQNLSTVSGVSDVIVPNGIPQSRRYLMYHPSYSMNKTVGVFR
jgi:hypothetical protein